MIRCILGQTLAIPLLLLALCCTSTTGRFNKRSGYHYKTPSGPAHGPAHSFYENSNSLYGLESQSSSSHEISNPSYYEYKPSPPTASSHHHGGGGVSSSGASVSKPGYSIGSGLRSIAQGSANQAYTAVANQHSAAKQAAFIAKNTLAQAASQAAATAQAALAGKQVILQELEQQAAEAQRSLSRELDQLKSAKMAAQFAQQTAQAANHHISVLTAAVNNAKSVAEHAEQTSNEVANQLASQSTMVGQARSRVEQVEEQLKQARVDFDATKEAALKAASSAAEAQVNASKAAAYATIGLHESTNQNPPSAQGDDEPFDAETTALGHEVEYDRRDVH
ncbi:prophage side tail fiber protein homolog StfR [Eurosta solidaginis]|uniref:prophage side tail fiber protein homolog StfR n=1 Tax=Eurosta solidaginis TaxID=178769 RepID=UPI0035313F65